MDKQWYMDRIKEEIAAGRTDNAISYASYAISDAIDAGAAEISRLTAENAELRSGEYLARVVEERDRMREAHDLVSDWIVEGTEDLPDDTPVTIKIGSRSIILDELKNLRAALSPSSTTGEAE